MCKGEPDGPGIIPARAGSTIAAQTCYLLQWDHLRSCGEHDSRTDLLSLIPARAGSTPSKENMTALYEDHPRSCGEHAPCRCTSSPDLGSSPLVRGARTD